MLCGVEMYEVVKKVVLGCKTGLLEKVNILRSGSAQVIRVCIEKVSGKMIDYGQCVENYGQKIVKKIEPLSCCQKAYY